MRSCFALCALILPLAVFAAPAVEVSRVPNGGIQPQVATDSDGVATFVVTSPQYTGRGLTYSSREGAYKPILRITGIQR